VDDEHAWGNILSRLLEQKVTNYGVGGYGTDQSFLRFLQHIDDQAEIIFLNHLSSNVIRNVTRYHYLVYPKTPFAFKPRYVLNENEELKLIPIPSFSELEIDEALLKPERHLPYEFFLPGGAGGLSRARFPYLLSVVRAFGHFHVRAKMTGRPCYMEFYEENHPSNGLRLTVSIMAEFERVALARGKTPVITIMPTGKDLVYRRDHGVWPYKNLLDLLSERNVEFVNIGECMIRRLGNDNPRILFRNLQGHFNEKGNDMLAHIVHDLLRERGLILQSEKSVSKR